MANLTSFGKAFRKFRIDNDLTLKQVSEELGLTPAYLSGIETGRKPLNLQLLNSVIQKFGANHDEAKALEIAASQTMKEISIPIPTDDLQSQLAVMFARRIENNKVDLQKFFELLEDK